MKTLVVGIGHPDRSDDGVGAEVVRLLAGRVPDDVALHTRLGDMLGLLDDWAGFDRVVCIDASEPAGTPGRLYRFDLNQQHLPPCVPVASSHAIGLAEAVALSCALGSAPADVLVFAVEGLCFDHGTGLTAEVAEATRTVADRIVAELAASSDAPTDDGQPDAHHQLPK